MEIDELVTSKDEVISKAKKVKKQKVSKEEKKLLSLEEARQKVLSSLGDYKDSYKVILSIEELSKYIDNANKDMIVAIDTETMGLNPITDKIVGFSLKSPSQCAVYVPINHRKPFTQERLEEQLTEEQVKPYLQKLIKKVNTVWHNAKFDIRVLQWSVGIEFAIDDIWWDTQMAAQMLNENEEHGLKYLYNKYCINGEEKEIFKFNSLFDKLCFADIPYDVGYIYAAHDAEMTLDLYNFQYTYLKPDHIGTEDRYSGISYVFNNIEMPCIYVVAEMENQGVKLDLDYAKELSIKYHALEVETYNKYVETLKPYEKKIITYNENNDFKLNYPVNFSSPKQLAILIYDILKTKTIDKKRPRGTGKAILKEINNPITNAILECRTIKKLLSTYIDKLPTLIDNRTNKLHSTFKQDGTVTGRFSSKDPNFQNIPSHNKDIRKMFIADDGYVLVGGDFSQQEPRSLASIADEPGLKEAYKTGKDVYAWVAALIYHLNYEDCLEHMPDGTINEKGKERRSVAKAIVLGLMYSKGSKAIAEDLGISKEEADNIFNTFFLHFPKVKQFIQNSQKHAYETGYVETAWGRKRRLPDLLLDPIEIKNAPGIDIPISETTKRSYIARINSVWGYEDKQRIVNEARKEGIIINLNTLKIADAERECVNSIIQGSAADMVKIALINIYTDKVLTDLGFRLIMTIHDEVIGQCPEANAKKVAERLSQIMIDSAKSRITVPMKVDCEITKCWYGAEVEFEEDEEEE